MTSPFSRVTCFWVNPLRNVLMTFAQIVAAIMRQIDKLPSNSDLNYPIVLSSIRCVNPEREYVGNVLSSRGYFRVPLRRDKSSDCRGRGHAPFTLGTSPDDKLMILAPARFQKWSRRDTRPLTMFTNRSVPGQATTSHNAVLVPVALARKRH